MLRPKKHSKDNILFNKTLKYNALDCLYKKINKKIIFSVFFSCVSVFFVLY